MLPFFWRISALFILSAIHITDCLVRLDGEIDFQRPIKNHKSTEIIDVTQYLNGKKLRLVSLELPPFVVFQRHPNGTVSGFSGYCYEILHALQEIYNFTYEVYSPVGDKTYGKQLHNGSWTGMIGMVVKEAVDIGVSQFSVTHSRSKAIDFSVPFYEDPVAILIPPPAEDNRLIACAKPFRWEVWLLLISLAVVLPAILWRHSHFSSKTTSLAQQYMFVVGVLVGQSGQKLSAAGISPRLLGAVWCLCAVVFASAYVGILMSFLRFPKLSPVISKLEDLPASKLQWGVQKGAALEALFTEATTGIYKSIGDGFLQRPSDLVNASEDGISRVTDGNFAYFEEKSTLEFAVQEDYIRTGRCRLSIARHEFFKVNFAFALPKNSPIKPILDKKIMQMMESGLGVYWKRLYWPPSAGKCKKNQNVKESNGPKRLGLVDLQGAFFILAIGYGLASVAFITETILFRI